MMKPTDKVIFYERKVESSTIVDCETVISSMLYFYLKDKKFSLKNLLKFHTR